ncbi:diguanylate cyclase domain-containing protein [Nocardioides bruguierae]|uniref:Diguanylate cyclase n=1 Tax=Nocardioides bruguierae TaxID=2945102 RepID=A0A9X2DB64_9ACTN|nr:diguanylate cyclase [Nocardioides bruguierae]MCM0622384.1 diguanylate cyclase [Nocardioides bruguierae]
MQHSPRAATPGPFPEVLPPARLSPLEPARAHAHHPTPRPVPVPDPARNPGPAPSGAGAPASWQTDRLTGLLTRDEMERTAPGLVTQALEQGASVAVALVDVDRLKQVNDALGHSAGDHLLVETAQRLRAVAGPRALVARWGGDEFVLVKPLHHTAVAASFEERLREQLGGSRTPTLGPDGAPGNLLQASVGVAVAGQDGTTLPDLVAGADQRMYRDKQRARGAAETEVVTGPSDEVLLPSLASAVADPDGAGLGVRLHPRTGPDGELYGVEAVLRWRDLRHGSIPAARTRALAERHGLARCLDAWAVGRALEGLAALVGTPGATTGTVPRVGSPRTTVAVDVSARTLLDPALPGIITRAARQAGHADHDPDHPAARLLLQVSESAGSLLGDAASLDALTSTGARLSIPEHGGTRPALALVWANPLVGEVRLQPSFVARAAQDAGEAERVRRLTGAAHTLGVRVVAQGVADQDVAERLLSLGCDAVQCGRGRQAVSAATESESAAAGETCPDAVGGASR